MEAMRQSWTDDRLEDLSRRIDERFDHVEAEMHAGLERVEREIGEQRKDNREMRAEIGAVQRTMIQVGGGLVVAILGLIVTQL